MISCKEASRRVSQGLDRSLGFQERLGLRLHLLYCSGCRNFSRQMRFIRRLMRQHPALDQGEHG